LTLACYVRYNVHMRKNGKKVYSATEARKHFFKILDLAGKPGMSITITLEGRPPLVIMSHEELEGWKETLDIESNPVEAKELRKAMKEWKSGKMKTVSLEEMKRKLKL